MQGLRRATSARVDRALYERHGLLERELPIGRDDHECARHDLDLRIRAPPALRGVHARPHGVIEIVRGDPWRPRTYIGILRAGGYVESLTQTVDRSGDGRAPLQRARALLRLRGHRNLAALLP